MRKANPPWTLRRLLRRPDACPPERGGDSGMRGQCSERLGTCVSTRQNAFLRLGDDYAALTCLS